MIELFAPADRSGRTSSGSFTLRRLHRSCLDNLNEFLHPGPIVGPASDCHQGAIDDHLLIDELGPQRSAGQVRGPGNRSSSCLSCRPLPRASSGPWQLAAIGLPASTKWRTIDTAFGRFRRYSGARPPGRTRP